MCRPSPPPLRNLFPEARRAELTQEAMRSADVDPTLRPAQLTIAQVGALADAYARLCAREPDLRGYEFREELRLKHLSGRRSSVQVSPPPTPPALNVGGKATKELLLIACFGAGRQQIALSGDISTWRTHAFLKSSLPAPREPSAPRRHAAIKRSAGASQRNGLDRLQGACPGWLQCLWAVMKKGLFFVFFYKPTIAV